MQSEELKCSVSWKFHAGQSMFYVFFRSKNRSEVQASLKIQEKALLMKEMCWARKASVPCVLKALGDGSTPKVQRDIK